MSHARNSELSLCLVGHDLVCYSLSSDGGFIFLGADFSLFGSLAAFFSLPGLGFF